MKKGLYILLLCLGLSTVFFAAAGRVHAALGESVKSVASDMKALSAARGNITSHDGYTVQEINSPSVAVREYISASGVVFGVAWNGLVRPDLTQLLGSYAAEYRETLRQTPRARGRRSLRIETNHIVVEEWGHMRNLRGRAYVPDLIPPGVSVDEIN
ncbi:MAG: DUF2844 domain-containing protein [Candidatus Sulfobium sp.]|jgi:Protein of unknown function (DUF2844)